MYNKLICYTFTIGFNKQRPKTMKKITNIFYKISLLFILLIFIGCKKKNPQLQKVQDTQKTVTFHFKAEANGMSDFMNGMIMFQNAYGNQFGITNLKYIVSDIVLHKTDGTEYTINNYHFVNINDTSTLSFTPSTKISAGNYDYVQLIFGLTPSDNVSGSHPDLNLISWNWPTMMGGGYHFMQLEGNFKDSNNNTVSYQTHLGATINPTTHDTINNEIQLTLYKNFTVSTNSKGISVDILMNVDQWYENPTTIDLNQYGTAIMGNYDAQMLFHTNGENGVFSVSNVTNN